MDTWLTYPTVRHYLMELTDKRAVAHAHAVSEAQTQVNHAHVSYWDKISRSRTKFERIKRTKSKVTKVVTGLGKKSVDTC